MAIRIIDRKRTGEEIERRMKEKDITIRDISERLGLSYQSVAKWIKGKSLPNIYHLYAISRILGCTVDDIVIKDKAV